VTETQTSAAPPPVSAWAPLRHPLYRALWTAQIASNIGTWMQTVGAQWLMGTLGGSALEIALVQVAMTFPVFLVALPAGALGDILDRRRLLLAAQALMLAVAAALAAVTFAGAVSPWLLLGLTFALGLASGLTAPSWQAIVPELVPRDEIPLAAALSGVNHNVARAIGPAIGGIVVAAAGPAWTFALNAVSFLGTLAVIQAWRRPPAERALGPEHIVAAMRSGVAYARHAPRLRAVFARAALFVVFAGALWALLPVYARDELHLGSGGYGLLLGAVGIGAVLGAVSLARVRGLRSPDELLVAAGLGFAVACGVCAVVHIAAIAAFALVLAGASWIATTSSLNGTAITVLPSWVRSRGLALYTLVFQGGQALSALAWGLVAQFAGSRAALGAVAGGLVAGLAGARRWRMPAAGELDVSPQPWPVDPPLVFEPDPSAGPILVTVEYRVAPERHERFRDAMREVGRARRRTGAERWGLFQDGAAPEDFVETFVVATWEEHLRQHSERSTAGDRAALAEATAMAVASGPPRVRHLFFAYDD
jgi:MFS family permease